VVLTTIVPPEDMTIWGWRIPLLAGCVAIPLVLWLRRSLEETEAFKHSRHVRALSEVLRLLIANWGLIVAGIGLTVMTTTSFYLITAYTPTYGKVLGMAAQDAQLATLIVGISNVLWLLVGGVSTDRYGARAVMLAVTVAALITAYPAMLWLVADPGFSRLVAVLLLFSVYFGLYNGALIPLLAEIMPHEVRTTGFSLAFVTATAIFGGFTPAICTYLVEVTGNKAAPALWLSLAAGISLIAALVLPAVQSASLSRTRAAVAE